jgi:uncharacterized protein RhaS with RHS repeats
MKHVTVALPLLSLGFGVQAKDITYYYTDPQGTVLATADANGNLIAPKDFTPFGRPVLGAPEQGPGYTGHMADADTGLNYMRARYYIPSWVGSYRWTRVPCKRPTLRRSIDLATSAITQRR